MTTFEDKLREWERIQDARHNERLEQQEEEDWRRELEEDMQAEDNYEKENKKTSNL